MNGWLLAVVAVLWAISVTALIFFVKCWRIVEDVTSAEKRKPRDTALADARDILKKARAGIPKKAEPSLEILGALAQDNKLIADQIKKWLSEKDDVKKK